ncbi:MAG TPA: tandem-95 repeat protein, partial [Solirubrobacteraceae bacterium]
MSRARNLLAFPLLLALLAIVGVSSAQAAVDRDAAAKKALAALGTADNDDPVIVFGTTRTIRARSTVTEAGPGATVPRAEAGNRYQRARAKRIGRAGVRLHRAPVLLRTGDEASWFFFEDRGPHQMFEHQGRVVVVGATSGKVTLSRQTSWVPLVDGRAPAFFRSTRGYESKRYRVLSRPWAAPGARSRARTRQAPPSGPRQQVADALAAEKSCALRISDTLGDFLDFGRVDKTRARLGLFFEGLEKLNAGFVSRRYTTSAGRTPMTVAQRLIDEAGCKDLFLYLAGGAPRTGDGGIVVGMRPAAGGLIEWQVITAADLEALVKANPSVTFKFLFDAPHTAKIDDRLIAQPNTVLLLAAGAPGEGSFTFLPEVLGPDGVVRPSANPDQLLEFTNAILAGLNAFADDPDEVARWLAGRALGGPSMMSWMMARALQLSPAALFASPLAHLKLPVLPTPPLPPAPPTGPPPAINHAPTPTTPAQPTAEDTPKSITLTATDADGDPLTFTVTSLPTHGTLTGTPPNLVYTPARDFDGNDSFTYTVADNRGGSNSATVQIPVTPDNDAAAVTTLSSSAPSDFTEDGAAVPIDAGLTVSDPDNANLVGATVRVLGGFRAGDQLVFSGQNGITGSYDSGTGVLTLTGTATKANYQTALRSVQFDSTSQDPGTSRTIEFRAEDGGEAGVPASRQVTVEPVNDAPTVSLPGGSSTSEDTSTALSPSVGDVDAAGDDVKVDLGVDHGTLTLSTVSGLTSHSGDGTGTVSLTGSLSEVNAAITGLNYTPAADFNGTDTLSAAIDDLGHNGSGGAGTDSDTAPLGVTAVNDAPVNTVPGAQSVAEDATKTLSGANAPSVADVDAGGDDVKATVSADHGDITLNGTTAGSVDFTGTVGEVNAKLDGLQYTPDPDFDGADTVTIVTDDLSHNGSGGARSDTDTIAMTVTGVNDGPTVVVPAGSSTSEDTSTAVSPSVGDIDAAGDDVKLDLGVDHGTLTLSTVAGLTAVSGDGTGAVSLTGSPSEVNAAVAGLNYTPATDFNGADTLSALVDDLGHNGSGGALTGSDTAGITVAAVNDAPVVSASPGATDVVENVAKVVDGSVTVGDVDDTLIESATVAITTGFDAADALIFTDQSGITGVYHADTGVLNLTGTASKSDYQAALRSVEFQTLDDTPAATRDIEFKVSDGDTASGTSTKALNVEAVNDEPTLSLGGATTSEDTSTALSPSVGDIDAAGDDVKLDLSVAHGTLTLSTVSGLTSTSGDGTGALSLTGSVSEVNAAVSGLNYTPAADFNGDDTLSGAVNDLGHNGSGGALADGDSATLTISAVNDAPVNTVPGVQSATEDTTKTLSGSSAPSVADVDAGGDDVKVTLSADHGDITLNGTTASSVEFTGSVADVNTKLDGVQYTPDANYSGSDTITMVTDDLGHNGSGGAKSATDTIALTVTGDNDAPVLTVPGGQTTDEDTGKTMSPSVDDPDAGGDDVKVDLSAAQGTLTLATQSGLTAVSGDGTGAVSLTGSLSEVNAALTNLLYMPASNYHGSDSIGVTLSDLGHNGAGGTQTDSDAIGITVVSINDAPVNTVPGGQSFNEDTTKTFSGGSALSVADADAGTDDVQVTLDVDHGTLKLSGISGLSFSVGDGSDDAAMTFSGAISAVNTALHGLEYTPASDYNGSDTLSMDTSDLGHNGTDGAKSDSDTVSLSIPSVNDAPVNTVPHAQALNEDTQIHLSSLSAPSVADSDAAADDVKVTFSADHGTLTLATTSGLTSATGNGTGSVELVGSLSEVNAALDGLQYAPAANYNGSDTLTMLTDDLAHNGGAAKSDTDTIGMTVDPVNDAPVATADSYSTDEDTPLNAASVLSNDNDVDGDTLTAEIVAGPSNASSFTLNTDGTFSYTPNADFNGADSFTYKAKDAALDSNTVTVDLTINAINDAPVNTVPGTQTINEDSNLVLSGGNAPTIVDVDAASSTMKLTLTVEHGTLTLGSTTNLTVNGEGGAQIAATGSKSDLNNALNGLTYNPTGNFDGADAISMKTEDNGHNGTGGNKSDTDSITVNVTGVNDGP